MTPSSDYDRLLRALVFDACDTPERSPERTAAAARIVDFHQREWPLLKLAEALKDAELVAAAQNAEIVLEEFRDVSTRVAGDVDKALLLLRATSPLLDHSLDVADALRQADAIFAEFNPNAEVILRAA